MTIKCPKCERVHEMKILMSTDNSIICDCGEKLGLEHEDVFERLNAICKEYKMKIEEEKAVQIRKMADKIVSLIINKTATHSEVEEEKSKLKELINNISPEDKHLYDLIYEPRFERLWNQFR